MPKFKKSSGFRMGGWSGHQDSTISPLTDTKKLTQDNKKDKSNIKPTIDWKFSMDKPAFDPRAGGTYEGYVKGETHYGRIARGKDWWTREMSRYSKTGESGYVGSGNLAQAARSGGGVRPWWEEEEDLSGQGRRSVMTKKKMKKSPKRNYKEGYYKESPAKKKDGQPLTISNPPQSIGDPPGDKPQYAYRVPSDIRAAKIDPRGEAGSMGYHVSTQPQMNMAAQSLHQKAGTTPDPLYMDWATGEIHSTDPTLPQDASSSASSEFDAPIDSAFNKNKKKMSVMKRKSSGFKMKGSSLYRKRKK